MTPRAKRPQMDMKKVMELWTNNDLKLQVLVFFHKNPGVIESVDGLAARIGTTPQQLSRQIADHVDLGILRKTFAEGMTLLVYDRKRETDLRALIEGELTKRASQVVTA